MHIILVPGRVATARTVAVTPRLVAALIVGFLALCVGMMSVLAWLGFGAPVAAAPASVVASQPAVPGGAVFNSEEFIRDNISAMAAKVGEMQAQIMRLDSLGERVSKMTGVAAPKGESRGKGGQGGPLIPLATPSTLEEMQREIAQLANVIDQRTEALTALESQLMERRIKSILLPTITPINARYIGSLFGRRTDPIAGVGAMHEGIDFVADTGTSVIASAGGVVTQAEYHPEYGYLIEIDHGNAFSSVYAHLSKMLVKEGQLVKRGQSIGASGNSGRSTGPHLHFEVRYRGAPQNPERFLGQETLMALGDVETVPSGIRKSVPSRKSR